MTKSSALLPNARIYDSSLKQAAPPPLAGGGKGVGALFKKHRSIFQAYGIIHASALLATILAIAACDPYPPTFHPDYAIKVTPTAKGGVATPPECPSYATEIADPFDNQPLPQFGCASARNLAAMVERPGDLLQGRPMGEGRGTIAVGSIRRYDNNQSRGLLTPAAEISQKATTTAPSDSSPMTGDVTAGGSSTPSTSGAASSP